MTIAEAVPTPQTGASTLSQEERTALAQEERAIARKYVGGVPWIIVAWGLGNFALWVSLWPLTMMGIMPLWAAFIISTLSIGLCYLPSHDAQHSIIARKGEPLRWLNEMVGHLCIIGRIVKDTERAIALVNVICSKLNILN